VHRLAGVTETQRENDLRVYDEYIANVDCSIYKRRQPPAVTLFAVVWVKQGKKIGVAPFIKII
jgi:hypothetical protein